MMKVQCRQHSDHVYGIERSPAMLSVTRFINSRFVAEAFCMKGITQLTTNTFGFKLASLCSVAMLCMVPQPRYVFMSE